MSTVLYCFWRVYYCCESGGAHAHNSGQDSLYRTDVDAAIVFYTELLGFQIDMHPAPEFVMVSRRNLRLLLNRPGAGGAGQPMPDGQSPTPGGWNRIQLEVEDLAATVVQVQSAGARFRNTSVLGNGGQQILVEDPSGNPIELSQPTR